MTYDPKTAAAALTTSRYATMTRTGLDVGQIATWDPGVLRDARLLVPIDLQALYVPAGDGGEPMVFLPSQLRVGQGQPPMPPPFAAGTPRPAGVHLHWALPDGLLRGRLKAAEAGTDRLDLGALPDRWAVIRLLAPDGAAQAAVRGWVLDAGQAKAVPLDQWPAGAADAVAEGAPVAPGALTATAGGMLGWVACYDGTLNRFAFHDPLDDLPAPPAPRGVANAATYLVAGWYSDASLDPLDGAYTGENVHERITALGWTLEEGGTGQEVDRAVTQDARAAVTLPTATRFAQAQGAGPGPAADAGPATARALDRTFTAATARFTREAGEVLTAPLPQTKAVLLHGAVQGVPVTGPASPDLRPAADSVRLVLGRHGDDLAAGLAAPAMGAAAPREAERLITGFTGDLLRNIGTPDGVAAIEEREHAQGFASFPGGDGGVDRLVTGAAAPATSYGRAARTRAALQGSAAAATRQRGVAPAVVLAWADTDLKVRGTEQVRALQAQVQLASQTTGQGAGPLPADSQVREVTRPAPRWHLPLDPVVAVSGAVRSLGFGSDGRGSPDGLLHCRWPSQVATELHGVLAGSDILPSLGSGALPEETLLLAREALLQCPYLTGWLAAAASATRGADAGLAQRRLLAEAAIRYGTEAAYRSTTSVFSSFSPSPAAAAAAAAGVSEQGRVEAYAVADQLRRFSLFNGVDPDLVGVTAWIQPWRPVWLEWEVQLVPSPGPSSWLLGSVDLEEPAGSALPAGPPRSFTGRTLLAPGTARQLGLTIDRWLENERIRDPSGTGLVDKATTDQLATVSDAVEQLDVLTTTLDGMRQQLLGLPFDLNAGGVVKATGTLPAPTGPPQLMLAGTMTLVRARVLDTFGRTLDLDVSAVGVPVRTANPAVPGGLLLPPRATRPSRLMFRLVDAASTDLRPAEANVDQADPGKQVNPVSGFLLPDHVDEGLEVFDTAGRSLGQLSDTAVGGAVAWEIAPGRPGPADAGPGYGLDPAQAPLGWFAAGLVAADTTARRGLPGRAGTPPGSPPDGAGQESALSALLRVIDTTLWSFDPFAALGSEHVAGLVGRPVAVVRARLWLELEDDLDDVDLSDPQARAERQQAYRDFAVHGVPVRIGELTRSDDGLLAFFVDDDYSRVRVVDKVVAELARESGRLRGFLTTFGTSGQLPAPLPVTHPYVAADDELRIHLGQTVTLTLLMHPAGAVNLTSGLLPRKSLRLARDWVAPGLAAMSPSVRVGPVLVDPKNVRMPKVAALGQDQTFSRRDTPSTWKDDPILAATQAALLPDDPAVAQEGWIRVTPVQDPAPPGGTP